MELSSSLPLQQSAQLSQKTLDQKVDIVSLDERQAPRKLQQVIQRNLSGYLFLLPALLVFALFVWYPIVLGFVMSFENVDVVNPANTVWVGWGNYRHVLADPLFAVAWRNTLEF